MRSEEFVIALRNKFLLTPFFSLLASYSKTPAQKYFQHRGVIVQSICALPDVDLFIIRHTLK